MPEIGKALNHSYYRLHIASTGARGIKRPGNQTQFSTMLESQRTDYKPINDIIDWIYGHMQEDITVEKLAGQSVMSPRDFARVFVQELRITPIKYVEKLRIEAACRHLIDTQLTMDVIAHLSEFNISKSAPSLPLLKCVISTIS